MPPISRRLTKDPAFVRSKKVLLTAANFFSVSPKRSRNPVHLFLSPVINPKSCGYCRRICGSAKTEEAEASYKVLRLMTTEQTIRLPQIFFWSGLVHLNTASRPLRSVDSSSHRTGTNRYRKFLGHIPDLNGPKASTTILRRRLRRTAALRCRMPRSAGQQGWDFVDRSRAGSRSYA